MVIINGVERPKIKDITNLVSGFLIAKKVHHVTKDGDVYWDCFCTLDGNVRIVKSWQITSKRFNSCGCLSSWRKKPGEAGFNFLYGSYKASARKRGYSFSLTKDEFKRIVLSNCFYCGIEPSNELLLGGKYTKKGQQHAKFIHNGIDRVSNSLGYELTNCIPCCKQCNIAKNILGLNEFLLWIKNTYEHLKHLDMLPKETEDFIVEEVL